MHDLVRFVSRVKKRLLETDFDRGALVIQWRQDAGFDLSDFSDVELMELAEFAFRGDWNKVAFAFSELLAYYASLSMCNKLSPRQLLGWICAALVISKSIRMKASDWEFNFDNFITVFVAVRDSLQLEEAIQLFLYIFSEKDLDQVNV